MLSTKYGYKNSLPWLGILALSMMLLVSCGSSSTSSTSSTGVSRVANSAAPRSMQQTNNALALPAGQAQEKRSPSPQANANQYLVKTLKVSMQVQDTRKVANALQSWITSTDTRSISVGTDYEQTGNNTYTIDLTFSVQSSLYPSIYNYLRNYSTQNGGHLAGFTETVQDVSGDYVDTQSRLTTLHAEQARLIVLMNHAQAMGDIVTIEQRLTDVEGQIETYEGGLKNLTNQLSFYNVQIHLDPIDVATPPPADPAWSIGQVFQQAFSASIMFAQVLLTFLIWLLAFAWYAVPVVAIIWLTKKFKLRMPKFTPESALPKTSAK